MRCFEETIKTYNCVTLLYVIKVGKSKNEALDSIVDQMDDVAVEGLSVDGLTSYFLVSPGKHTRFQGPKFS